jgi:hypothetical protein
MKDSIKAIPMVALDTATLAGAYKAINTDGLPNACGLIRIINDSNTPLTVSYDGVTAHDYVGDGEYIYIVSQLLAQPNNYRALFSKGTKVYVKSGAGVGYVMLVGYYQ